MTVPNFVLFLMTGRLLTWFLQTNGLLDPIRKLHPLLEEMNECDLCLGFWVFLIMSILLKHQYSNTGPGWFNYLVQATFSTFVAHLLRLGWNSKFGVMVI